MPEADKMTHQHIESRLAPHKRMAWFPVVEEGENSNFLSKFSGNPMLLASEVWPCCKNCKKPMQLFIQLDSRELPEQANRAFGEGYLQVFYCTNDIEECDIECEAYLPFAKSTLVRVIEFDESYSTDVITSEIKDELPQKTITDWVTKVDYPSTREFEDLDIIMTEDQEDFIDENGFTLANDKLLGWPLWVQGLEYPDCPICSERMDYIFQIDSEDNLDFMFGDSGCSHITQCQTHKNQLTIAWACC